MINKKRFYIFRKNWFIGIFISYISIIANMIPTLIEVKLEYLWGSLAGIGFIIIWIFIENIFNFNKFISIFFQIIFFVIPFVIVLIFVEDKNFNSFSMITAIWTFNIIAGINLKYEYFLQKKKIAKSKI